MVANAEINAADRVAPNSEEAEVAVLGSILYNSDSIKLVSGYLSNEDFFILRNNWIFEAMLAMAERGEDIDNITLIAELRSRNQLDLIGGSAYITSLLNNTPTHIHIETYAKLVEKAAVRRRILKATGEIASMAVQENRAVEDIIMDSHDKLTEASRMKSQGGFTFINEFASRAYDHIERVYNGQGEPLGIPTGLLTLDQKLTSAGYPDGAFVIIAARPGMGKTSLALGSAIDSARHGKVTAFISKEMTGDELHFRILAAETGIPSGKLQSQKLSEDEYARTMEAISRISQWPLAIDDTGVTDIDQLIALIIRLHREMHVDIVFFDYLQLLYSDEDSDNRNQEVTKISGKMKKLARTLHIPIIALSQLNRKVEIRADKRPNLADLRDSGSLEQDADIVIFIYRDDYYDARSEKPGQAELIIAKQRNGRAWIGEDAPVVGWVGDVTKFRDIKHDIDLAGWVNDWNK